MLWNQSLKSIHYYRTLLIFQNKKTTDLRVKTWWDKRHVIPPPPKGFTPSGVARGGGICPRAPPRGWRQNPAK